MPVRQKAVENLIILLQSSQEIKLALEISLQKAEQPGIETLEDFYNFLDNILTHIPTEKELMPSVRQFYFLVGQSPGDILKRSEDFNNWIQEFVVSRGDFLDTPASTATLESFIKNPEYKMDDYQSGPSGWQTYNQFLARQLKPGRRPVAGLCNDKIIVSPADSTFKGQWQIEENATITVKGNSYSVAGLLSENSFYHKFKGGQFTHSFLAVTDYHRYHLPVSGIIREVKKVPAGTWVHEQKKSNGSLENTDDVGFQFAHTRGYIIIESPVGLVVVMPVGMGHISSVTLTAEKDTRLKKGDEFGYFAFGGSDIIMMFEPGKIKFTAKENTPYRQGEEIAVAV